MKTPTPHRPPLVALRVRCDTAGMTMTLAPPRPTATNPHHPLTLPLVIAQYALFGMTFAATSVLWKDIIGAAGISEATFGLVLAASPIVGTPLMLLGGHFGERFGLRLLPTLGAVLLMLFCGTLAAGHPSLPLLLLAVMFQGVGNGIYDLAINAAAVDYERRSPRSVLNAIHACFNVGAVTGALAVGGLRSAGVAYPVIVGAIAVAYAALVVAIWLIPPPTPAYADGIPQKPDWRGTVRLMWHNPALRLMVPLICCALCVEGLVGTWAILYLRQDIGVAAWIGGASYALFNVMMAAGRFGNQWLVSVIGARRALLGAGAALVLADALALATVQPWLVLVGVGAMGLAAAGLFPTGFLLIGRAAPGSINLITGIVFAFAYIAFAATSPVMGAVADAISLRVALGILALLGVVIAGVAWLLPRGLETARLDPAPEPDPAHMAPQSR